MERLRAVARSTPDPVTALVLETQAEHRDAGQAAAREVWEQADSEVRRAGLLQLLVVMSSAVGSDHGRLTPARTVALIKDLVRTGPAGPSPPCRRNPDHPLPGPARGIPACSRAGCRRGSAGVDATGVEVDARLHPRGVGEGPAQLPQATSMSVHSAVICPPRVRELVVLPAPPATRLSQEVDAAGVGAVNGRRYGNALIGGIFTLLAAAVGGSATVWAPQMFGADASQRSADASTPPADTPAPTTPSTVPAANPAPLTGRFQGAAQQDDAGVHSQYRMNITLHPAAIGQSAGTSHYDVQSGPCDGRLTLTQPSSDGTSAQLTEAITTGGCIPYGTVKVTVTSATQVLFEYWGTLHDGGTEYVHATLDRVG